MLPGYEAFNGLPEFAPDEFAGIEAELDKLLSDDTAFPVLSPLPSLDFPEWMHMPSPELVLTELFGEGQVDRSDTSFDSVLNSNATVSKQVKGNSKRQRQRAETAKAENAQPSRWKRDQSKMGTLENEADEKQAHADEVELENRQLKLRATAMVGMTIPCALMGRAHASRASWVQTVGIWCRS